MVLWVEHYREALVDLLLRACTCKCMVNINASNVSLQKEMEVTISFIEDLCLQELCSKDMMSKEMWRIV